MTTLTKDDLISLLPQNLNAERGVLCAVLLDNDALAVVAGILNTYDFSIRSHQKIFEAMLHLYVKGEPVDLLSLREELSRRYEFNQIGGAAILAALIDVVPTAEHVVYHATLVRNKAIARKLLQILVNLTARCYEEEDMREVLNDAQMSCQALKLYLPEEDL